MSDVQAVPHGRGTGIPYPFDIRPLTDTGGAEITGLDLAAPLDDGMRDAIMRAFLEFHILVFRGQSLTKDQQAVFSKNFGELEHHVGRLPDGSPYPIVHTVTNLDEDGKPTPGAVALGNYFFHTDKSYHDIPSLMTMLHAIELPPSGGDTQFANTQMAYDALSPEMKARISGFKAEHSWEASRRNSGAPPATEEQKRERPPVVHPIVRTHPDTGRKSIYLGNHVYHILGLPAAESDALIAQLMEHVGQPQFTYTHQWRDGDYVMWDNRCLLHRALRNYEMATQRRVLHRTVIIGTAPY
jgi:alpha-ketoglutarate-dependent taurine dioxygenase